MQALLDIAGIATNEVTVEVIGYAQVEMLMAEKVDAAVVYLANEPVQLEAQGFEVTNFAVSDYTSLVGNGIVTNIETLETDSELVKKIIQATLRGMQYAAENPDEA